MTPLVSTTVARCHSLYCNISKEPTTLLTYLDKTAIAKCNNRGLQDLRDLARIVGTMVAVHPQLLSITVVWRGGSHWL